ncbi:putative diguanylate cyclase YdaM [compost metagenome]
MPWMKGYPYYLLLVGIISLYMGIMSYRFRRLPGRRYLWILLLLIGLALTGAAAEIMAPMFKVKLWLRNIQQIPLFLIDLFAYAAVKNYTAPSHSISRKRLALLASPILLYFLLIFTDSYHHLMRSAVGVETVAGISGIYVKPTLLSMGLIAYDQLFSMYAAVLLLTSLLRLPRERRKPHIPILIGMLIPVACIVVTPALHITLPGFTALVMLPAVVAIYFTVYRRSALNMGPSVTDYGENSASQGVAVIGPDGGIVSVNETGERLMSRVFGPVSGSWAGRSVIPYLQEHPSLLTSFNERRGGEIKLHMGENEDICWGVSLIPLGGEGFGQASMLLMLKDYSDEKRHERELKYQASMDDLTGLSNRRHFLNTFNAWKGPDGDGLAMLLMDIDDFKLVNDTYGHLAGDQALISFARKLRHLCRNGAFAGRLGGEEFALCLPVSGRDEAMESAEAIRHALVPHNVMLDGGRLIQLTVSIGVVYAEEPDAPFEELYRQADQALYISKTNGKNMVTMSGEFTAS